MIPVPRWLDGLGARIAVALLAVLIVQFVADELLFRHVETTRIEHGRTDRLAEQLAAAQAFFAAHADAPAMTGPARSRLSVTRSREIPPQLASAAADGLPEIRARIAAVQPEAAGIRLVRIGDSLEGALRLEDGTWLHVRSEGHFRQGPMLFDYTVSALLVVACVALMATLLARMIARPLHRIAQAAEAAGHGKPVAIAVEGPREVRQVARAFEAMQAQLLGHVREQVQSLAAVSHDLRTPLARLRLNASTVEDAETRMAIERDLVEMDALVTSVLDFLRGDEPEAEQLADISSIVLTVIDEASDLGGDVAFIGPERMERITRPLKLKRAIRNIVQNAVRHGGNARVRLDADDRHVVITVDDDGPGIPPDRLEAAFQPFVRFETAGNSQGAGLGLSIAHRLATRLGGSVTLRNRPEGGLSATIRLPAGTAPADIVP